MIALRHVSENTVILLGVKKRLRMYIHHKSWTALSIAHVWQHAQKHDSNYVNLKCISSYYIQHAC